MSELQWISIGKLAKATGFAVERIRMWEQRYGAPLGRRLASGHRRYNVEEVERLHLVREALARGKRPRQVVALKREALMQLLGTLNLAGTAQRAPKGLSSQLPWGPTAWLAAVSHLDDSFLDRQFYEQWLQLGSLNFLVERAQPFAEALARGRSSGQLGVAEERFGSEKLGDFLASLWRRLNENNTQHSVLLSTLPGDPQTLNLQMMALVLALAGLHVTYLGAGTPLDELIGTAKRRQVKALLLGYSPPLDFQVLTAALAKLREGLPPDVQLGVGSDAAPPSTRDFQRFQNLAELFEWARQQVRPQAAPGTR